MRQVTVAHTAVLVGDEVADLLLDYAVLVAQLRRGDSVHLDALGPDGEQVSVGFLLNSGCSLVVESSRSRRPEPDNAPAVAYLRRRLAEYDPDVALDPGVDAPPRLGLV